MKDGRRIGKCYTLLGEKISLVTPRGKYEDFYLTNVHGKQNDSIAIGFRNIISIVVFYNGAKNGNTQSLFTL